MKITFLGTASMVPTKERAHTAILVSYKNENILVDCGENTQRQLKLANISPTKVTKILISHWHGDHILGLPGLIESLGAGEYKKTLEIYGPKKTKNFIKELFKIHNLERKIKIKVKEVKQGKIFDEKDFYIEAKPLKHNIPTLAYNFIIKDKIRIKPKIKTLKIKGPILKKLAQGKNIRYKNKTIKAKDYTYKQKGKKLSIILDTKYFPTLNKIAKDADLLISEATYEEQHKDKAREYSHLTSKQAAEIAKKAKVKQLILTHFSQRYKQTDTLTKEAKKIFKNTKAAEDFLTITL